MFTHSSSLSNKQKPTVPQPLGVLRTNDWMLALLLSVMVCIFRVICHLYVNPYGLWPQQALLWANMSWLHSFNTSQALPMVRVLTLFIQFAIPLLCMALSEWICRRLGAPQKARKAGWLVFIGVTMLPVLALEGWLLSEHFWWVLPFVAFVTLVAIKTSVAGLSFMICGLILMSLVTFGLHNTSWLRAHGVPLSLQNDPTAPALGWPELGRITRSYLSQLESQSLLLTTNATTQAMLAMHTPGSPKVLLLTEHAEKKGQWPQPDNGILFLLVSTQPEQPAQLNQVFQKCQPYSKVAIEQGKDTVLRGWYYLCWNP